MKRVVLVRPGGPRNVGMIARVCANFGPCELRLVAPERPSLLVHPDFEQMSHGVPDREALCVVVPHLRAALEGTTFSVGFSGRAHDDRTRREWRGYASELASLAGDPEQNVALVFGNEIEGLREEDVHVLNELVVIETTEVHPSLNLAMAVGVVLSALFTDAGVKQDERGFIPIRAEAREYLKANLKHVFGDSVAKSEVARHDILESIERVFSRAPLEDRDARAWHLMLRALGSTLTPNDVGLPPAPPRARRKLLAERAKERAAEREERKNPPTE